jgi:uncharacterized Zn-finger protein
LATIILGWGVILGGNHACARITKEISRNQADETCCPGLNEEVWNGHPRVFLSFNNSGNAKCPYCGTKYQLKD